jgi:DNA-binding transcriptional ArsR family regulator
MRCLTLLASRAASVQQRRPLMNSKLSKPLRVPVKLITDESQARLISDPMRREILRLLSQKALTEKELAGILGITAPSVDHHLKSLLKGNLISVVRKEAGRHGIVQTWYIADAEAFIVERDRLRPDIRRYFMSMDIERTRGVVAVLSLLRGGVTPSTGYMESMTRQMCTALANESKNYTGVVQDDPERTIHSLYVNALRQVLNLTG